jgi:hypothetical protein
VVCFLALLPILASCSLPAHRAFYYWKTAKGPSADELALADRAGADRLYVRLFDIDETGAATPALAVTGSQRGSWTAGGKRELVPVVYIANDALAGPGFAPREAARSLVTGVTRLWDVDGPGWKELQLDCDWTETTQKAYFAMLAAVRGELHAQGRILSATIRLHQVKYRRATGVPPVDRGMLMAYNLLPPQQAGERSAILDPDELAGYLRTLKSYPLPLDVALPAFSWVVQWEGERLIGLIGEPRALVELESPAFRRLGPHRFEATRRTFLAGHSVEPGDLFVTDRPGPGSVTRAAALLSRSIRRGTRTVALYHLDIETIDSFAGGDDGKVEAVFDSLGAVRGGDGPAPRLRSGTL